MDTIDKSLEEWRESLCESVDVGGLYSKNPIAHKWKALFRSLSLRESVGWRLQDLLFQSKLLSDSNQQMTEKKRVVIERWGSGLRSHYRQGSFSCRQRMLLMVEVRRS